MIFPIQKVWVHVIYGFFPDPRSIPHHFCHSLFSPYGYVCDKQCSIVLSRHRATQIIGSPMPGKLVVDFRPPVMVHGHLCEFYVYLAYWFDIIILLQPSPYNLIHITCSLVVVWALEGYFCIPQSVCNCYSFYPWVLLVLKNAANFECQTNVLIEPQCFSAPVSSHSLFK